MGLPKTGTKDWDAEKEFYLQADKNQKTARAKALRIEPQSYERRMRERGVLKGVTELPELERDVVTVYTPYPKFDIKPFKQPKTDRDEEDIVVVTADKHLAKVTDSYNIAIAKARMDKLIDSTMTIINLHRPIRRLWVFELGDALQGENPYQGSKIGEVECGAYEQVHEVGVPIMSRFLTSLASGVGEVDYIAASGNHGVYDKEATKRTNWDNFLYSALESALVNQKNVHIHTPKEFYRLVNIRGFRFFLIHGNQVYAQQGIPLFAMRRKMQEWYAYLGGFNYGYAAHFHSGAYDQVNSHADYTICPPLVTGDSWALERVGRASAPVQLAFGIHDVYGRTWEYKLRTDDAFMPQRFNDEEGVMV
uniref:Calcineurin-like phosphoesterase n=1 Tax=viral metagenome TaxID=1070528 RepID=A0A6M3LAB2_9ZZZZ